MTRRSCPLNPDLEEVFANPIPLYQNWLKRPEAALTRGSVMVSASPQALAVNAVLEDRDIHSDADADGQKMWELGDTFEIFLAEPGEQTYFEFHVTPSNHQLRLRLGDPVAAKQARETGEMTPLLFGEERFESHAVSLPEKSFWIVTAILPASWIVGREIRPGDEWECSFCRYDAGRGRPPVISSTSALTKPDFHRRHEWDRLVFVEGAPAGAK